MIQPIVELSESVDSRQKLPQALLDDRGAVLVSALMAMLVVAAIGMMLSATVAEETVVARNHFEIVSCLYICDAGVSYAIQKISSDSNWSGLPSPGRGVGSGNFTVAVSDSSDGSPLPMGQKSLIVTGTRAGTTRVVEVIVQ